MATNVTNPPKKSGVNGVNGDLAKSYKHPEADNPMRPDIGTQAQFKKKKKPRKYLYDSSLSPALNWDGKNSSREPGETLIQQILEAKTLEKAKESADKLRKL